MGVVDDLLTILSGYSKGYALMRKRLGGYTGSVFQDRLKGTSDETIRTTLYRLKRKGFVQKKDGIWKINELGKNYLVHRLRHGKYKTRRGEPKRLIISFDIPESYRRKRDWLRVELVNLGFEMLHRSVWLGPAPLPSDFVETLEDLRLMEYMKFFEARESDVV